MNLSSSLFSSLIRYVYHKDVLSTLLISQRCLFVRYVYLKDVFNTLLISQRCL